MKTKKTKYEDPRLLIILLEDKDVIATSGNEGSLGSWDGGKDVDSGGWT